MNAAQKWTFLKAPVLIFLAYLLTGCGAPTTPQSALAPAGLPSPTTSPECAAGRHTEQVISNGQARHYILYVPAAYQPGKPAALIFGFHGNNGRADYFESSTGFSPLAEREGFIVAYPQGAGEHPTWDTWQGSKDVQFVYDLID